MKPSNFKEFSEALHGVSDYYRQKDRPTAFTVKIWWESLKEFELEAVQRAFVAHINRPDRDGQFMPTVASVKQLLGGTISDSAASAWIKVTRAVQQVGTGTTVVFDDALVHACIAELGGWMALGQKTEEEWPWLGKAFEARYRAYAQRGETPDYPRQMLGYYDSLNGKAGFEESRPTLIGDPDKAMRVMQGGTNKPLLQVTEMPQMSMKKLLPGVEAG